jgi:hypothetical protein
MNVNTKFSSAQFPTYTATGKSQVIRQRPAATDGAAGMVKAKTPAVDDRVTLASAEGPSQDVISDAEKQFFENLFPASAGEIRSYSPYGRNGMKQSVTLGSLVDLKG